MSTFPKYESIPNSVSFIAKKILTKIVDKWGIELLENLENLENLSNTKVIPTQILERR